MEEQDSIDVVAELADNIHDRKVRAVANGLRVVNRIWRYGLERTAVEDVAEENRRYEIQSNEHEQVVGEKKACKQNADRGKMYDRKIGDRFAKPLLTLQVHV